MNLDFQEFESDLVELKQLFKVFSAIRRLMVRLICIIKFNVIRIFCLANISLTCDQNSFNLTSSAERFYVTNISLKFDQSRSCSLTMTSTFTALDGNHLEISLSTQRIRVGFSVFEGCSTPSIPLYSTVDYNMTHATYACLPGYSLSPNKSEVQCLNGTWDLVPRCIAGQLNSTFRVVTFRTPKSWSYVVWLLFVLVTIHAAVHHGKVPPGGLVENNLLIVSDEKYVPLWSIFPSIFGSLIVGFVVGCLSVFFSVGRRQ